MLLLTLVLLSRPQTCFFLHFLLIQMMHLIFCLFYEDVHGFVHFAYFSSIYQQKIPNLFNSTPIYSTCLYLLSNTILIITKIVENYDIAIVGSAQKSWVQLCQLEECSTAVRRRETNSQHTPASIEGSSPNLNS